MTLDRALCARMFAAEVSMTLRELLAKLNKIESDRQRRLMDETTERNGAAPVSVTTVNGVTRSTCTRCGATLNITADGGNANIEISEHRHWCIVAPSATVELSTTVPCKRCGVEVSFGPVHSQAAVCAAMADHEDKCFVIGDRVRTTVHPIIEGDITSIGRFYGQALVTSASGQSFYWLEALRRIPHPEQAAARSSCGGGFISGTVTIPQSLSNISHGPQFQSTVTGWRRAAVSTQSTTPVVDPPVVMSAVFIEGCVTDDDIKRELTKRGWSTAWPNTSDREPIAPTLYDGITAKQCLDRMLVRMAAADGEIDPSRIPDWPVGRTVTQELVDGVIHLTTSQLAAARELWSAQLRAKVEASREAERHRVTIDQDADDLPW